mmetsp:Transcript_159/g.410  ORF Transcript_159/g.410 Transcript_159/m.410 type:complete len:255 (+) Transcript_159:512-1276(+)
MITSRRRTRPVSLPRKISTTTRAPIRSRTTTRTIPSIHSFGPSMLWSTRVQTRLRASRRPRWKLQASMAVCASPLLRNKFRISRCPCIPPSLVMMVRRQHPSLLSCPSSDSMKAVPRVPVPGRGLVDRRAASRDILITPSQQQLPTMKHFSLGGMCIKGQQKNTITRPRSRPRPNQRRNRGSSSSSTKRPIRTSPRVRKRLPVASIPAFRRYLKAERASLTIWQHLRRVLPFAPSKIPLFVHRQVADRVLWNIF